MEVYMFTIRRVSVHMCVLSRFSCVWLFATLWTMACQVPLSMGFYRQEYCSGLPCPPLGDLPNPGIESTFLMLLELAGSLPLLPPGKLNLKIKFRLVIQSSLTLCDTIHQLTEPTQTHVHWVSDAIQPSHPLSSPSPPTFNLSQHQGLFKWVTSLH